MTVWWVWLAVAVAFGMLEVLVPTFVFLGFSAGAAATGLLLALGLPFGAGGTMLCFALLSVAAYAVVRLAVGSHAGRERIVTRDINDEP